MSALKCTKCPGYMLPDIGFCSRDENNIWSCNKCNFQTTEAKVSKLLSSIENKITKISRYIWTCIIKYWFQNFSYFVSNKYLYDNNSLIYRQPNSAIKLEELLLILVDKHLTNNHYLLQELKWNLLSGYEQNKKNKDKDALKR